MSIFAHTDTMAFNSLYHNFDKSHVLLLNVCVYILVGGKGTVSAPQLGRKLPEGFFLFFIYGSLLIGLGN